MGLRPPSAGTGGGVPAGGSAGQVLKKNSGTDGDATWQADQAGALIQDETTTLTARSKLAVVGPDVRALDDAAGDRTILRSGRRPPVETYREGMHYETFFRDKGEDEAVFDFINTQRVLDGTLNAIQVATAATGTGTLTTGSATITAVTGGPFTKGWTITSGSQLPGGTTILDYNATAGTILLSSAVTGAGGTGLTLTSGGEVQPSMILSKARHIRHFDVRARFRPMTSSGSGTLSASALFSVVGNYLSGSPAGSGTANRNYNELRKKLAPASPILSALAYNADTNVTAGSITQDATSGRTWWIRMRRIEDVLLLKAWPGWTNLRGAHSTSAAYAVGDAVTYNDIAYVNVVAISSGTNPRPDVDTTKWVVASEPDWQVIRRIRPTVVNGVTGGSSTTDNTDIGGCGFWSSVVTGFLYELSFTELVKSSENLLANSDFRLIDSTDNVPVLWYRDSDPVAGNTMDYVDLDVGPFISPITGAPEKRRALHMSAPNLQSMFWTQAFFGANQQGPNAFQAGRARRFPIVNIPPVIEIGVWSKAQNIVNPSGGTAPLSAGIDVYYYDREGSVLVNQIQALGTGAITSGSPNITGVATTQGAFAVGQAISGSGIPSNSRIGSFAGGTIGLVDLNGNPVNATATNASVALTATNYAGRGAYYLPLGPNPNGDGTWDWYETKLRLPLNSPTRVGQVKVQLGFHDAVTADHLWLIDPVVRAVG